MKNLPLLALLAACVAGSAPAASAATVFSEDFDQAPYVDQTVIRFGYNWLHYGQWVAPGSTSSRAMASNIKALSGPMSLQMTRAADKNNVRVQGEFGETNKASSIVTEGLQLRLALNFTSTSINTFFFAIRGPGDVEYAKVTLQNGSLYSVFNGASKALAPIANNTWYYLEFLLPENPSETNNTYTVRLYAEDGSTLQGEETGIFSKSTATGGYTYFYTGHDTLNESVFIDNITATTVPEANMISFMLIGLGSLGAASIFGRRNTFAMRS